MPNIHKWKFPYLKSLKIRLKITLVIILLLLLLIPVFTFVNINVQQKSLKEEGRHTASIIERDIVNKGIAVTRNLALASETAVSGYDFDFLNMIVYTTVQHDHDALYGIITNNDGMAFVHTDNSKLLTTLIGPHDKAAAGVTEITVFETDYKNEQVTEVVCPIYSGGSKWGVIRIGFTMKSLNNELKSAGERLSGKIRKTLLSNLSLMLLFLIIGAAAAYLIGSRIVSPIKKLTEGAGRISSGYLDERVEVDVRDEIGELADSFNLMAETLQKREREIQRNYKDLKLAYSQLDEYKENLEKKVSERTKELEEAYGKLKTMQEELLTAERLAVVGEMSGRIAHEILNPMTSIFCKVEFNIESGKKNIKRIDNITEIIDYWEKEQEKGNLEAYLSEISRDEDTNRDITYGEEDIHILKVITDTIKKGYEHEHKDLFFILKNLKRVIQIIDQLRGMSRAKSAVENLNINEPIKEAAEVLSPGIEKRKISFIGDYADGLPSVKADFNELIQVFSNILKNASQAISGDERCITVATCLNGQRVEVRIKDTGKGIAPENIPKLFHSDFTDKSPGEGTGLGLGISRRLIRKYKGDIEVEKSEPGRGTTFLIYLPV